MYDECCKQTTGHNRVSTSVEQLSIEHNIVFIIDDIRSVAESALKQRSFAVIETFTVHSTRFASQAVFFSRRPPQEEIIIIIIIALFVRVLSTTSRWVIPIMRVFISHRLQLTWYGDISRILCRYVRPPDNYSGGDRIIMFNNSNVCQTIDFLLLYA